MKKYSDIISGAVLFVLAAVYYVMATQIKQYNAGLPGTITSDFIPKVYGIAVMVLSAILIFRGIRDLKKAQVQETGEAQDRKRFPIDPAIVLVFLLLVVYVALLDTVGFTIMSTLFVLGLSYILLPKEKRTPKTCVAVFAVALAFSVAITLIFVKGFSLTLPMGILG